MGCNTDIRTRQLSRKAAEKRLEEFGEESVIDLTAQGCTLPRSTIPVYSRDLARMKWLPGSRVRQQKHQSAHQAKACCHTVQNTSLYANKQRKA